MMENGLPSAEGQETRSSSPRKKKLSPAARRRRRQSREKENRTNGLLVDWRRSTSSSNDNDATATSQRPGRSRGISAPQFHSAGQEDAAIREMRAEIAASRIQQETRKLMAADQTKRTAYKQVATCKLWPLQRQAVGHWKQLMGTYLQKAVEDDANSALPSRRRPADEPDDGDEACCSSLTESSSSANTADPEPKRLLRHRMSSPAQSRLLAQCKQEFLRELGVPAEPGSLLPNFLEGGGSDTAASSDSSSGSSLEGRPALWSMEPRLFACEQTVTGKRRYLASHAGRFLDRYWRKTEAPGRHWYELIREQTPVRLYLDLEFSRTANPAITGEVAEQLLTELWEELAQELQEQYAELIQGPLDRSCVVDLDSSTPKKFSRHWIAHLPAVQGREALFLDAATAGKFMQQFVGRLAGEQAVGLLEEARPALHEHFFVHTDSDDFDSRPKTCFIDMGVYTRNRLFRLMGSCKFGKSPAAALRIAAANQFPFPEGFGNECFYLPSIQDNGIQQDKEKNDGDVESAVQKLAAKTDWTVHAEALAQTLVVPMNVFKLNFCILAGAEDEPGEGEASPVKQRTTKPRSAACPLEFGASPYPMVDEFVLQHLAARGETQGSIRAWSIESFPGPDNLTRKIITYHMSRNRWCECVGRSHRSNNIMWNVDVTVGECFQTCHDPDCRAQRFRGEPVPLPEDVRAAVAEALFDEELAALDEEALLREREEKSRKENLNRQPQKDPPSSFFDEDESFEKALAALNLDGDVLSGESTNKPVSPPSDDPTKSHRKDSPLQLSLETKLEKTKPAGEEPHAEAKPAAPPQVQPKATQRPRFRFTKDDSSSSDDEDLLALVRQVEQRKKERAAKTTAQQES